MQRVYTQIAGNLTVFYVGISVHGGRLRYEGIGQIQKWCNFLKGDNLRFKLDVNSLASLDGHNFKSLQGRSTNLYPN